MAAKPFLNIFSTEKTIPQKEFPKEKIIMDYREKNSLVYSQLIKQNFEVEIKGLKVADYIVKETAIERKTVSDFISSMINRRLLKQLEELQQYENKILIIEGIEEQELYNDSRDWGVSSNAIRGFLLSILLKYKIPLLFTKNEEDTAKFLNVLSKKQTKETSLKPKKKSLNKKEQMQFILEGFPGIGPKTAKKLLEEFKSIKEIINTPLEKLEKILGKKANAFKEIIDSLY